MANLLLHEINAGVQNIYNVSVVPLYDQQESIRNTVTGVLLKMKPDVLITIGAQSTIEAKKVIDDMNSAVSAIFVGLRDPISHAVVASYQSPGGCFTGVTKEVPPVLKVAQYFAAFYPLVKSVLIPYSENDSYLLNQAIQIKRYLTAVGMNVFIVPVSLRTEELAGVIKAHADLVKGVIFLEGCVSNAAQEEVAFWCWKYEIIFCGSGLYSIDNGAACGLGASVREMAGAVYKQLRTHWEHKVPTAEIPVIVFPNDDEFWVNVNSLRRLDVPVADIARICAQPGVRVVRKLTKPFKIE